MPKRSSKDFNETTSPIVLLATGQQHVPKQEKNPAAVELGRLGGLKGGKARAAKLTKDQRSDIASKAAAIRWAKKV